MAQWPKDAQQAENRVGDYRHVLARGVHIGRFIRWVEGATREVRIAFGEIDSCCIAACINC